MAEKEKDIQRVGGLYRGLTGLDKSARPEDVEGQQSAAVKALSDRDEIEEARTEGLEAQQESADKNREDRFKEIDKADKKSPAKKSAAKKSTAKKSTSKAKSSKKS